MKRLSRAILLFAFQFRSLGRIARCLESMLELYTADCLARGVQLGMKNPPRDEVEIAYGLPPEQVRVKTEEEEYLEEWELFS